MEVTQAKSSDEIKPLIELCKAGKLFEVQEWIKSGTQTPRRILRDDSSLLREKLGVTRQTAFSWISS